MAEIQELETARFYTRSRRFPKVIGRFHDGTRIPGGPYTVAQVVIGGVVALVALTTRAMWGTDVILLDIPLALGIAWGAAWAAGRIPATRRNLLLVVTGAVSAASRPAAGRYRNQQFRLRPPHRAAGAVAIATATTHPTPSGHPDAAQPPATATAVAPRPLPTPAKSTGAVSGVERLLQQTRSK